MNAKLDDRSDNVERIQENINNTVKNIRLANEVIEKSDNPQEIENMIERNKRRKVALDNMRCEIKEEARARENSMQ